MNPTDSLMQEFQQIHERIFELACRKAKYAPKMSDALNKAIDTALENEYKTYYGLYREKLEAAVEIDLYAIQEKNAKMVPRQWRNWWSFWILHKNDAAILTEDRIEQDAHLYYQELMEHLDALKTEWDHKKTSGQDPDQTEGPAPGEQMAKDGERPAESAAATAAHTEIWEEENAVPEQARSDPSEG